MVIPVAALTTMMMMMAMMKMTTVTWAEVVMAVVFLGRYVPFVVGTFCFWGLRYLLLVTPNSDDSKCFICALVALVGFRLRPSHTYQCYSSGSLLHLCNNASPSLILSIQARDFFTQ